MTVTYFAHVIVLILSSLQSIKSYKRQREISFFHKTSTLQEGCEKLHAGVGHTLSFMMLGNAFIIIRLKVSHYFIAQAVLSLRGIRLYFALATFDVP